MPYYDFQCEECGEIREGFYKIADAPDRVLILCQAVKAPRFYRRILSLVPVILKGKGWSKDGYDNATKHLPGGQHSGQRFIEEYRKAVDDPEHPYKPGDGLKAMGRKGDDFKDLR